MLGIPCYLTIGRLERDGRPIFPHGEEQITRFVKKKRSARYREGVPFHRWLTSRSLEILDLSFAMNLRWANTDEKCEGFVVCQPVHEPIVNLIYHPLLVGDDFFKQAGAMAQPIDPALTKSQ